MYLSFNGMWQSKQSPRKLEYEAGLGREFRDWGGEKVEGV